jgi:hypothetical protein
MGRSWTGTGSGKVRRPARSPVGVALACIGGAGPAVARGAVGDGLVERGFVRHSVATTRWLTDLVLVDFTGDGLLDISTSNHAVRPLFLENRGGFGFGPSAWTGALAGTRAFPLLAGQGGPAAEEPGLYLFGEDVGVRLVARGLGEIGEPITLLLPPGADPAWIVPVDADGSVRTGPVGSVAGRATVPLHLSGDASVTLAPVPGRWEIDASLLLPASIEPGMVRLGADAVPAPGRLVSLSMRDAYFDWHGTAWVDLNGDGRLDVYANQGGFKGEAVPGAAPFNDMLRLSVGAGGWLDAARGVGIESLGRPGRGVQPVDIDRNGLVDFAVVNSRSSGPPRPWANALHAQHGTLAFRDEGEARGAAFPGHGHALWFDADGDGWTDLAWGDSDGVWIYRNERGRLAAAAELYTLPGPWSSSVSDLALADADRDGDLDLAVARRPESFVLRNDGGSFTAVSFGELGLPVKCWGVHWVDADNDGVTDLYAQPGGLFLGREPEGAGAGLAFEATGLLADDRDWSPFAWGDLDGDGRPDLVRPGDHSAGWEREAIGLDGAPVAVASAPEASVVVFENDLPSVGHWLQLDLAGPPGNPQAIGTAVLLEWGGRLERAWVGQANASGASMGQYRLAFGLGRAEGLAPGDPPPDAALRIDWADGHRQTVEGIAVDRLVRVAHPRSRD